MIRSKIALCCKRAKTMGFFCAFLALVLHLIPGAVAPTHAQGSRKDDIVFNSRGIPLAGATVRVCAMPASGQPCNGGYYVPVQGSALNNWKLKAFNGGGTELSAGAYPASVTSDIAQVTITARKLQ